MRFTLFFFLMLPLLLCDAIAEELTVESQQIDPLQNDWYAKYKTQANVPKPNEMLLNTDAEPELEEGFQQLFNGKDLTGWTPRGGTCTFEAKNGVLIGKCVPGSASTYLCTDKSDFNDFVFTCDMKWEVDGNSGVMFRAQVKKQGQKDIVFGPQAEMEGTTNDRGWSGGIYGQSCGGYFYPLWLKQHQAARDALKANDWNRITVMAKGNTVKTWVNGVPASHWIDDGSYPRGFFGLQIHSHEDGKGIVLWKNVRVKNLSDSESSSSEVDDVTIDQGPLEYQGSDGPGVGKHIVFLAGDHEYRSEEALPALARILAKHHGFKCTVLFNVDPESGVIVPGNNNMPHTNVITTADLLVFGLRFQNFSAAQMQPIVDYLDAGGPVVGTRTSTHAFQIPANSEFAKYDFRFKGDEMPGGFGRQVLGETWAGHYGKNHVMSTRLDIVPDAKDHPVLRGVKNAWVETGGYWTEPESNSVILANAQPLQGMTPDSPPAKDKTPCPGAWVRTYKSESGNEGRVFTTTYCASEDLRNDGFRRMMINSCFWAMSMEEKISGDLNTSFVGPYHPATFRFGGYRQNVKPQDLAGWDSPIMSPDKEIKSPERKPIKSKQPKAKAAVPAQ